MIALIAGNRDRFRLGGGEAGRERRTTEPAQGGLEPCAGSTTLAAGGGDRDGKRHRAGRLAISFCNYYRRRSAEQIANSANRAAYIQCGVNCS